MFISTLQRLSEPEKVFKLIAFSVNTSIFACLAFIGVNLSLDESIIEILKGLPDILKGMTLTGSSLGIIFSVSKTDTRIMVTSSIIIHSPLYSVPNFAITLISNLLFPFLLIQQLNHSLLF